MFEYFYAWTPLLIVGAVLLLALPGAGLIALMIGALAVLLALAALVWAIVAVPYSLIRAVSRSWHGRGVVSPRTAAALTPASPRSAAASSPATRHNG